MHTLIPLEDFKALLGVDDREDKISRFCLVTASCAIEQYCKRLLLWKNHHERIGVENGLFLPLNEYPVRVGVDSLHSGNLGRCIGVRGNIRKDGERFEPVMPENVRILLEPYRRKTILVSTFKIFMATNHKPIIKGTDHWIWRRIKVIPFMTTVAPEKQDKHLEQKLLREGPGILNWLLEGTRRWCSKGLKTPDEIVSATDEYRAEIDVIGNFIRERYVQGEGCSIRARKLFKVYQDWCGVMIKSELV